MATSDLEKDSVTFNEEIKKIRTNIKFSSINEEVKVIAVTSSLPGEGKSLISANLAASFAQYDEKVLLIDCDLRKGRQMKLFSIPNNNELGLSISVEATNVIEALDNFQSWYMLERISDPVGLVAEYLNGEISPFCVGLFK